MPGGSVLRVCHVVDELHPAGTDDVLVDLASAAPSAGLELTVLALAGDTDTGRGRALCDAGARVESLRLSHSWDVRGLSRGLAAVRRLEPAVIHTHLGYADLVGSYVARRLRLPHVSTLPVLGDDVATPSAARRQLAALGRSPSRVIAVSDAQRGWYEASHPERAELLTTVPNGVAPPRPMPAERRKQVRDGLGLAPRAVFVLTVAPMRPGMGHDTLLDAVRLLPPRSPVQVALAGDGELWSGLELAVRADPRLDGRVQLLGNRDDVPDLLQAADLLVQPSHVDASSTILMRGLAAGVAIVATDVGSLPEIVAPGTGVIVSARDPAALAAALGGLATSHERRVAMGRAGRVRFRREFAATVWARRLREVYEAVTAGAGERPLPRQRFAGHVFGT